MKYLPHILLAYVAIALQRGLDDLLTLGSARLSLPMLAAVFIALRLPRTTAPLAAVLVGLGTDLTGAGPIGAHAVAFGVAAFAVVALPSNRPLRLWGALALGALVAGMVLWILGLLRAGFTAEAASAGPGLGATLGTVLLTGLFALPMSWPLHRWGKVFHVEASRF